MKVSKTIIQHISDFKYLPQFKCYSMKCHLQGQETPKQLYLHQSYFFPVVIEAEHPKDQKLQQIMNQSQLRNQNLMEGLLQEEEFTNENLSWIYSHFANNLKQLPQLSDKNLKETDILDKAIIESPGNPKQEESFENEHREK